MSEAMKVALVISGAGIFASFLIGGRYTAVGASRGTELPLVYVVDRFTGNVWGCTAQRCVQAAISN